MPGVLGNDAGCITGIWPEAGKAHAGPGMPLIRMLLKIDDEDVLGCLEATERMASFMLPGSIIVSSPLEPCHLRRAGLLCFSVGGVSTSYPLVMSSLFSLFSRGPGLVCGCVHPGESRSL